MSTRSRIIAVAVTALLTLAGCSGGDPAPTAPTTEQTTQADPEPTASIETPETPQPTEASDDTEVEMEATEGSVTTPDGSFVEYPDGMRVTIGAVEVRDALSEGMGDAQPGDFAVIVTQHLENTGTEPIPFSTNGTMYFGHILAYGPNQMEAQGYFTDGGAEDALPGQLAPGSPIDVKSAHLVPADGLTALRYTVNPNSEAYLDYTFTDVETLLP